ncbi:O-methyltransferase [Streptomyces sp. 846.5]|nr:methyltransferase [Streptomyces sp. 846.5]TDT97564.1 O-methyltransferase [Streptomyces sp. 846.5]
MDRKTKPHDTDVHAQALEDAALMRALIYGHLLSRGICVAAQLGIPERLEQGPRSAEELAEASGACPQNLRRLLSGLVAFDVFVERADGAFELAPLGRTLTADAPGSVLPTALVVGAEIGDSWNGMEASVRTGHCAFDVRFGTDFFSYLSSRPRLREDFYSSQAAGLRLELDGIARLVRPVGDQQVVDVGGGDGALLAGLLTRFPEARGLLVDQPDAVAAAAERFGEAGLARRCAAVVGDFFEEVPGGGDVYLLRHILHDWDDESCLRILRTCRRLMPESARLVVIETLMAVPGADRATRRAAALMDLYMMSVVNGRERKLDELVRLLDESGFCHDEVAEVAAGAYAVVARAVR